MIELFYEFGPKTRGTNAISVNPGKVWIVALPSYDARFRNGKRRPRIVPKLSFKPFTVSISFRIQFRLIGSLGCLSS